MCNIIFSNQIFKEILNNILNLDEKERNSIYFYKYFILKYSLISKVFKEKIVTAIRPFGRVFLLNNIQIQLTIGLLDRAFEFKDLVIEYFDQSDEHPPKYLFYDDKTINNYKRIVFYKYPEEEKNITKELFKSNWVHFISSTQGILTIGPSSDGGVSLDKGLQVLRKYRPQKIRDTNTAELDFSLLYKEPVDIVNTLNYIDLRNLLKVYIGAYIQDTLDLNNFYENTPNLLELEMSCYTDEISNESRLFTKSLKNHPSLRTLTVNYPFASEKLSNIVEYLSNNPTLTKFSFDLFTIESREIRDEFNCRIHIPNQILQSIVISQSKGEFLIESITGLTNLREINIQRQYGSIGDSLSLIRGISSQFPNLKSLCLTITNEIQGVLVELLKENQTIDTLNFIFEFTVPFNDELGLQSAIGSNKNIKSITIQFQPNSDISGFLEKIPPGQLRFLVLIGCKIKESDFLSNLIKQSKLEYLHILFNQNYSPLSEPITPSQIKTFITTVLSKCIHLNHFLIDTNIYGFYNQLEFQNTIIQSINQNLINKQPVIKFPSISDHWELYFINY